MLPSQASDLCTELIGLTREKTVTFQNITLFECKVTKIHYLERSTPTKCFGFGQIGNYIVTNVMTHGITSYYYAENESY